MTLAPGATLPNDFKKYLKGGKNSQLDLIGGLVLDVPDSVLRCWPITHPWLGSITTAP